MSDEFKGEIIMPHPQMLLPLTISPRDTPDAEMHAGVCLGGNRDSDNAVVFVMLHEGIVAALYTCAITMNPIKVREFSALDDVDITTCNLTPYAAPGARVPGPDIFSRATEVYIPSLDFCRFALITGGDGETPMVVARGVNRSKPIAFMYHTQVVIQMWDCLLRRSTQCRDVEPFRSIMEEIDPDFFTEATQDGG